MKERPELPREKIAFRVKPEEYKKIYDWAARTTCRNISEYLRQVCLKKPLVMNYRNQTAEEFLKVVIELKNDLVRAINVAAGGSHSGSLALMDKIEEIRVLMNQIYKQWSLK
jgi:hypothetical protein